jgi:MFS family permease
MLVLVVALIIDIMKPASLGFVVPGMIKEYGVSKAMVAWLPFAALLGTVTGSIIWGALADVFGRRASILLSAVMFVGTSICGAMPDFWWNVGMCFMMGAAAGGLLPVVYALLAETMPSKHRGWALVLVGGLGAVGGYLASSSCLGLAAAGVRLADHVVPEPAHRPDPDRPVRLHSRIGQVPDDHRPPRRRPRGDEAVRLGGARKGRHGPRSTITS